MAMSQEHKAALAQGRKESRAIKAYLEALATRRPGRPVNETSLKTKIERIQKQLAGDLDALKRVGLVQQRIDAEKQLASIAAAADIDELERGFVSNAKGYSGRKGISYAAWREAGVSAAVLKKAGITRAG